MVEASTGEARENLHGPQEREDHAQGVLPKPFDVHPPRPSAQAGEPMKLALLLALALLATPDLAAASQETERLISYLSELRAQGRVRKKDLVRMISDPIAL